MAPDARVRASSERPPGRFPFLLIDASYVEAREDERIASKAGLLVSGIDAGGYREVPGLRTGGSGSEGLWREMFDWPGPGSRGGVFVVSQETRRRERVIRIFPNGASAQRLTGALAAEIHEDRQGRRYPDMDDFREGWAAQQPMDHEEEKVVATDH